MDKGGRKEGQVVKPVRLTEEFIIAFQGVVTDAKNVTLTDKEVLILTNNELLPDQRVNYDQFRQWKSKLMKDKRQFLLHPMFEQLKDLFEICNIRIKQNITENILDEQLTAVRARILQFLLAVREPHRYSSSEQVRVLQEKVNDLEDQLTEASEPVVFFDNPQNRPTDEEREEFEDKANELERIGSKTPVIKVSWKKMKGL